VVKQNILILPRDEGLWSTSNLILGLVRRTTRGTVHELLQGIQYCVDSDDPLNIQTSLSSQQLNLPSVLGELARDHTQLNLINNLANSILQVEFEYNEEKNCI